MPSERGVTIALVRAFVGGSSAVIRGGAAAIRGSRPAALLMLAVTLLQLPDAGAQQRPLGRSRRGDRGDESVALRRPPSADHREFRFTRAAYTAYWGRNWATDYPKADRQFMIGVRRLLTHLDASATRTPSALDDPELQPLPVPLRGRGRPHVAHRARGRRAAPLPARGRLPGGGRLLGLATSGRNFESEIRRVLPGCRIVDLPPDHPLFSAFYDVKEFLQVPNVGNAMRGQHVGEGRLHAVLPRHLRRQGPPDGRHQREHRPRRRLGVGGEAGVPAEVLDLRVPDGRELHRLRDEPLSARRRDGPLDFESVFEFLFKYRPFLFEKGRFVIGSALAGGGRPRCSAWRPSSWSYARARGVAAPRRTAWSSPPCATAALAVVALLPLPAGARPLRPRCRSRASSACSSTTRAACASRTRASRGATFVTEAFGTDGALLGALAERFKLRLFRFAESTERLASVADLDLRRRRDVVSRARWSGRGQELSAVPLSGLVLVTDGADNGRAGEIGDLLLALKARSVPVFTVGLGRERFAKDVELTRVDLPAAVLKGTSVTAEVRVAQRGLGGSKVQLLVEDAGRVVQSQEITLPADGESAAARVHLTASEAGPRTFRFRIAAQPGEPIVAEQPAGRARPGRATAARRSSTSRASRASS